MMNEDNMIEAAGLSKRTARRRRWIGRPGGAAGSILGVLGPNGAGKTTGRAHPHHADLPDAGRARVAGHDVVAEAAAVRRKSA